LGFAQKSNFATEPACAYPNGLAFSPDEAILYVAISRLDERCVQEEARGDICTHRRIRAFDVAPDGSLSHNRVCCEMASAAPGVPDGLKVATAGRVWGVGSGGFWVIAPSGDVIGIVEVPEVVRNLAFGGPDCRPLSLTPGGFLTTLEVTTPGIGACR
jgi:gluconolactonase